jgi:hypothetical protein
VDLMGGISYLTSSDEFIMNFLFYFDMQFIGFADVPIDDSKYALVRIIETAQTNDAYTTILLLLTHDGQWDYIDEDVEIKLSYKYWSGITRKKIKLS